MTQLLTLADLAGYTEDEVKQHLINDYGGNRYGSWDENKQDPEVIKALEGKSVLIAYESVGSWGCDSSSWFLLRDDATGELYEQSGGHCSCYGFEGQFDLEPTTLEHLKSEKFYMGVGGYDDYADEHIAKVKAYIQQL